MGFTYVVTARHVLDGVRRSGRTKVYLRLNNRSGSFSPIPTEISDWHSHPDETVDVAFNRGRIFAEDTDHLNVPWERCVADEMLKAPETPPEGLGYSWGPPVGVGDEVFIPGLFSSHMGNQRNIPLVRFGNIATMREELVPWQIQRDGKMIKMNVDTYLIETRSIGGLSGSPVFVHLGSERHSSPGSSFRGTQDLLLGIVRGHYNEDSKAAQRAANRGIALVTPIGKVMEAIGLVREVDDREEAEWIESQPAVEKSAG
jgi:hypothetical protein